MIFWMFVILGVIALITWGIPIKDRIKLYRLERAQQIAYDIWLNSDSSDNEQAYRNYVTVRDKTRQELKDFKKSKQYKRIQKKETIDIFCKVTAAICAIILAIMSLCIIISYACSGGERARLEADYEVLSWEVKNNVYQDGGDDVVGKKELYNQVREWNSNLVSNQYYEKNFWIGIFVPNIYGDLKPIELN